VIISLIKAGTAATDTDTVRIKYNWQR